MEKKKNLAPLLIVLAAFLWSLDGLFRRSLYVLNPITIVFFEHLIGVLLLIPVVYPQLRKLKAVSKKEWISFFWVSLLSGVVGTLLYTSALGKVSFIQFSVVVLLQQLQPIFENFFGWLILKEKISKGYVVWAGLALVAAYMISFPDLQVNFQTGSGTVIAALLAIGAAFSWGSSTAFSRHALLKTSATLATFVRFSLSTVIALIFAIVMGVVPSMRTIQAGQLLTLLVIAFSTGMVALVIYYKGLKVTSVGVAAICELFWPVSAIILDYVLFHKGLTLTQIVGTVVLLHSIYQVSLRKKLNVTVQD